MANVNDAPTGSVTIDGTTPTKARRSRRANTLADADGLGAISYQWQRGGVEHRRRDRRHLHARRGRCRRSMLRVVASYTDGQGTAESVASAATAAVANVNDAPTGSVTISGTSRRRTRR